MRLGEDLAAAEQVSQAGLSNITGGEVLELDWANKLVIANVSGGILAMPWVSEPPLVGDMVQVGWLGRKPVCLGPKYGSAVGTVQTVGGGRASVHGDDDVTYDYMVPAGVTVASGQRVRLDHAAQYVVVVLAGAPPPVAVDPVEPPKAPVKTVKSRWFKPTRSGNWRGGFIEGNAEISDYRTGLYYYGTQIRDSIPNSATILEVKIVLRQLWDNVPGVNSRLRLHVHAAPGSAPTFTGSAVSVPGGSRTVTLSNAAGALFANGGAYGVAFEAGNHGWRSYASRATSGQLYVRWRV